MVINSTKNTVISKNLQYQKGIKKTKGLMFSSNPKAIAFKTRFGIHTFFMKYPIDVIILNKNYEVSIIKEHLAPNKLFFWNPKFNLVLELPQNTIASTKTQIGDKIDLNL